MDSLIVPTTFLPDAAEAVPPRDFPPSGENFAQVLSERYFQAEDPAPGQREAELPDANPDSSPGAADWLCALRVPAAGPAFAPGEPVPAQGPPLSAAGAPPSDPPAPALPPQLPLPPSLQPPADFMTQDEALSANPERGRQAPGAEASAPPPPLPGKGEIPFSAPSHPGKGQPERIIPMAEAAGGQAGVGKEAWPAPRADSAFRQNPDQAPGGPKAPGEPPPPPGAGKDFQPENLSPKAEPPSEGGKKPALAQGPGGRAGGEGRAVPKDPLAPAPPPLPPSSSMAPAPGVREGAAGEGKEPLPLPAQESRRPEGAPAPPVQTRPSLGEEPAYPANPPGREGTAGFSQGTWARPEKGLEAGGGFRVLPEGELRVDPPTPGSLKEAGGLSGERAEGVKAGAAPGAKRPEPPPVPEQVGQKITWLIRNNEERVRISLDPPHLGHIFLEISRQRENIRTVLWTESPMTKAALQTSQIEIQKIVESEGFRLEKFDVFVQQEAGGFQGKREKSPHPDPGAPVPSPKTQGLPAGAVEPLPPAAFPARHSKRHLNVLV